MGRVVLVVDAANVVGSRPDGWWRDRAGAAARLVSALSAACALGALDAPVVVVLEGAARSGAPEGPVEPAPAATSGTSVGTYESNVPLVGEGVAAVRVVHAPADGDSAIVAQVGALVADRCGVVTVVTADRALRERVLASGGTVLGPSWLRDRLP
jgi:hypothetical protein